MTEQSVLSAVQANVPSIGIVVITNRRYRREAGTSAKGRLIEYSSYEMGS